MCVCVCKKNKMVKKLFFNQESAQILPIRVS